MYAAVRAWLDDWRVYHAFLIPWQIFLQHITAMGRPPGNEWSKPIEFIKRLHVLEVRNVERGQKIKLLNLIK